MQTQQTSVPATQEEIHEKTIPDAEQQIVSLYVTEDKVDELFAVEKLLISELLKKPANEDNDDQALTLKVEDLSQKFNHIESKGGNSIGKERLDHLLSHLPFVVRPSATEVSLINPKSISYSKNGGAQCFLVVEASKNISATQEEENQTEVSIETIIDFVKASDYASKVKLLNSQDLEAQKANNQVRFLAEAHTFALAVQARLANDQKLSKLTKSYLE